MSLTAAPYILGSHAFFFREGDAYTVPGAGTCGRESKPGAADTGWIDLGVIEDMAANMEDTEHEVYAPLPGRLRLYDVVATRDKLGVRLTLKELGPFVIELLYRTLSLNSSSTQFNPLEGVNKKGWLKLQQYDQNDAQRVVMDIWSRIKISGDVTMGSEIVTANLDVLALHSTLNTGTL